MALEFSRVTLAGPLHTLAEAKTHLRVRDTDHDADVTQKLAAAQEAILAFLKKAADETWTPTTAPLAVKNSILLLLDHYYENRGADMAADAAVWTAIANNLAMYRDPGLG